MPGDRVEMAKRPGLQRSGQATYRDGSLREVRGFDIDHPQEEWSANHQREREDDSDGDRDPNEEDCRGDRIEFSPGDYDLGQRSAHPT